MLVIAIGGRFANGRKVVIHVVGCGAVAGEGKLGNGGRNRRSGKTGSDESWHAPKTSEKVRKVYSETDGGIAGVQWETQEPRRGSIEEAEGSKGMTRGCDHMDACGVRRAATCDRHTRRRTPQSGWAPQPLVNYH